MASNLNTVIYTQLLKANQENFTLSKIMNIKFNGREYAF